jgi:hypothetical protein
VHAPGGENGVHGLEELGVGEQRGCVGVGSSSLDRSFVEVEAWAGEGVGSLEAIDALGEGGGEVVDVATGSVNAPRPRPRGPRRWRRTITHRTKADEAIVELAVGAGFAGNDAFNREPSADGVDVVPVDAEPAADVIVVESEADLAEQRHYLVSPDSAPVPLKAALPRLRSGPVNQRHSLR